MILSSEQKTQLRELIYNEDLAVVKQGLELMTTLTTSVEIVSEVLNVSIQVSTADEISSPCWPPKNVVYLRLWYLAFLVEQQVEWACSIRKLNLNIDYQQTTSRGFDPTQLPKEFVLLTALEELSLHNNQLPMIPEEIASLHNLRRLDLEDNYIREIPDWIGKLSKLEELILSSNEVHTIPRCLGQLHNLTLLEIVWNPLWVLEDGTRTLTLSSEQWAHETVRNQVCQMSSLRFLQVYCEGFDYFPPDWSQLINLEELRISLYELRQEPIWLQTIPNLKRLRLFVIREKEAAAELVRNLLPDCEILPS